MHACTFHILWLAHSQAPTLYDCFVQPGPEIRLNPCNLIKQGPGNEARKLYSQSSLFDDKFTNRLIFLRLLITEV